MNSCNNCHVPLRPEKGEICKGCLDRFYSNCFCCGELVDTRECHKLKSLLDVTLFHCDKCLNHHNDMLEECESCEELKLKKLGRCSCGNCTYFRNLALSQSSKLIVLKYLIQEREDLDEKEALNHAHDFAEYRCILHFLADYKVDAISQEKVRRLKHLDRFFDYLGTKKAKEFCALQSFCTEEISRFLFFYTQVLVCRNDLILFNKNF